MRELEVARHCKIRGIILYLLTKEHPAPVERIELLFFLDNLNYTISEKDLDSYLATLEEIGGLTREVRRSGGMTKQWFRATLLGFNIVDGRKTVDGVEMCF